MDERRTTRVLPSPPPMAEIELPALINAATRKQHTELNRLIIERLPLALPPNAPGPATLGHGLAVFARIYYSFETAWEELSLLKPDEKGENGQQLRQRLVQLRLQRLCRSKRLTDDIKHIRTITGLHIEKTLREELRPMLEEITRTIQPRPHILIAYAWVMYMAIFSGGRWIRAQVADAGPNFWTGSSSSHELEKCDDPAIAIPGFSFLCFDGDMDGEDIKEEFKLRLKAVDELLTSREKEDVIEAAKALFDGCIRLVHMLDSDMQRRRVTHHRLCMLLAIIGIVVILIRLYAKWRQGSGPVY